MKKISKFSAFIFTIYMVAGCRPVFFQPAGDKDFVIGELNSRRQKLHSIEVDVKIRFREGAFLSTGLDGHAAYRLDEDGPKLRLIAYGPMGVQAFDLLVRNGAIKLKLAGREGILNGDDIQRMFGDSEITRAMSLLAAMPGIFFGGVPEGIGGSWEYKRDKSETILISPEGVGFRVVGRVPIIIKMMSPASQNGGLNCEFGGWFEVGGIRIPGTASANFDKKSLFSFKLKNWEIANELDKTIFDMEQ